MSSWQNNIRKVVPYVPGEQPDFPNMIKLNTNECPYPPAPMVRHILDSFDESTLRLYPDPNCGILVDAIAKRFGLPSSSVFVGTGSDDVLAMSFLTYFNSDKPLLFPDITYSFYDVWAELYRIPYERIPLKKDLTIDINDYKKENGGIIFPNPNAPTGIGMPLSGVEEILKANPDSVVIVDEAYVDFGGESAVPLLKDYENLLVVQTFSKSRSMAGLRIGFALGSPLLIGYLNDAKQSFNSYTLNRITLACGKASLEDEAYFTETVGKVVKTRKRAAESFKKLGFTVPESSANFLFVTHPGLDAKELFNDLKKEHIFVRFFDKPIIRDYLRVTIGTDEQMDALFDFLKGYLKDKGL